MEKHEVSATYMNFSQHRESCDSLGTNQPFRASWNFFSPFLMRLWSS